ILRLDSREHRWRSHAAAHSEGAAACPTAFAGTDAGTFAFTHATTLAGSDTAADTGPSGGRAGHAVRVTQVQQIALSELRELRSNNRRLDDQLRIGILRRLRIRRHELLVCRARKFAQRWRSQRLASAAATAAGVLFIRR